MLNHSPAYLILNLMNRCQIQLQEALVSPPGFEWSQVSLTVLLICTHLVLPPVHALSQPYTQHNLSPEMCLCTINFMTDLTTKVAHVVSGVCILNNNVTHAST
jgi:hypothetical protein